MPSHSKVHALGLQACGKGGGAEVSELDPEAWVLLLSSILLKREPFHDPL